MRVFSITVGEPSNVVVEGAVQFLKQIPVRYLQKARDGVTFFSGTADFASLCSFSRWNTNVHVLRESLVLSIDYKLKRDEKYLPAKSTRSSAVMFHEIIIRFTSVAVYCVIEAARNDISTSICRKTDNK